GKQSQTGSVATNRAGGSGSGVCLHDGAPLKRYVRRLNAPGLAASTSQLIQQVGNAVRATAVQRDVVGRRQAHACDSLAGRKFREIEVAVDLAESGGHGSGWRLGLVFKGITHIFQPDG